MGIRATRFARVTARCKGAALSNLAMSWFFQVHLPVHLPCYDLPPLYYSGVLFN